MTPRVSVGLPVYNGETYVAEAIDSVLGQTVVPDEFVVFDNCSTDETAQIVLDRLGEKALSSVDQNQGAVANFNRAVRQSSGEYFAWVAADDRLAPGFVSATVTALEHSSTRSACLTGIRFIDPQGAEIRTEVSSALASTDPRTRLRSYLRRPRWTESYCMYRREQLLQSPMFSDDFGADVLLMWWFVLREPLLVVDEPLLEYREYPTKSVADVFSGLRPHARRGHWLMLRLWLALWRSAGAAGVPAAVRRTARQELVTAVAHKHWARHLVWDWYILAVDGLGRVRAAGSSASRPR